MSNYEEMTREELLEEARRQDVSGRSGMNKDELLAAVQSAERDISAPAAQASTPTNTSANDPGEADRLIVEEIGARRSEMADLAGQEDNDERVTELQGEIADLEAQRAAMHDQLDATTTAGSGMGGTPPAEAPSVNEPTAEEAKASAS